MVNLKERTRKVKVEELDDATLESLEAQVGEKFREIIDKACEEANRIAKPYGFQVKMAFVTEELEDKG